MIGVALAKLAVAKGDEVVAIVRPRSPKISRLPREVKVTEVDLSTLNDCPDFTADVFFHLGWNKTTNAGRDDCYTQTENVRYTLDAVALADRLKCKTFVGAGSQAEYGVKDCALRGDTPVDPSSGYGIAKYASGKLSALMCVQRGIRHCWARILSVYGENDSPNTLISYLLNCFLNGETPDLTPCGQIWDYVHADDCARALYMIGKNGRNGAVYPIGSGNPRPLSDFVKAVRDAVDPGLEINFGAKEYYPHQPMFLVADISELTADTGFKPTISFECGIKSLIKRR